MNQKQPKNPLHGFTLEAVVTQLQAHYGWEVLARRINIKCFNNDPSIKSSLKFLRKTPWARSKVEALFIKTKLHTKAAKTQTTVKPKPANEKITLKPFQQSETHSKSREELTPTKQYTSTTEQHSINPTTPKENVKRAPFPGSKNAKRSFK